jgi:hypothetical protein
MAFKVRRRFPDISCDFAVWILGAGQVLAQILHEWSVIHPTKMAQIAACRINGIDIA